MKSPLKADEVRHVCIEACKLRDIRRRRSGRRTHDSALTVSSITQLLGFPDNPPPLPIPPLRRKHTQTIDEHLIYRQLNQLHPPTKTIMARTRPSRTPAWGVQCIRPSLRSTCGRLSSLSGVAGRTQSMCIQAASAGRTCLAISSPRSRSIRATSYWPCKSIQNDAPLPK